MRLFGTKDCDPDVKTLRDRIGELEDQVALLTRDIELLGACNDRLRSDMHAAAAAQQVAERDAARAEMQIKHLMTAHWTTEYKAGRAVQ